MLCQFYIINANNRYNNTQKNIPHTVSDKAGYMLEPKPITAALTNGHDKFYIIYRTNMKASLSAGQELNITTQRQRHTLKLITT